MSTLVTEVYDALRSAGAPEREARAAAGAVPGKEGLATSQGLAELRSELKQDLAELRGELKQDVSELRGDIKVLKFAIFTLYPFILALTLRLVFFPGGT